MSWDVSITDPETELYLKVNHFTEGGTYVLGGSDEANLNITWNYCQYYYRVLEIEGGLRGLNNQTVEYALPILKQGIEQLGTDESSDYWEPTEGNARKALVILANWCAQAIVDNKPDALIEVM